MKNLIIDKILLFILLSVSVLFGGDIKLEIIKSASPQYIEGNRTIYYTLTIRNTSSNSDYNTVTINDNMADGLFTDSDINITNITNSTFSCDLNTSDTDSEITCVGDMNRSQTMFIEYTVIAPDIPGQITNDASVSYDGSEIDTAAITVTIFPAYTNTLDYKRDICYLPPASEGDDCKQSGAFFYGPNCNTSTQIMRTPDGNTADETLLNLHVFKSYTSTILSDDCYTDETGVSCGAEKDLSTLLHLDSSSYLEAAFSEAHDFSLGNLAPDNNRTIVDINTVPVSGQGNNVVTSFEYIALIAQYNVSGQEDTIEEYIYPCSGSYGIPPVIAPLTSGGINDVDLNNVDITQTDAATYIDYASYSKVGTKIVKQPFILGVTYLDTDGNPDTYDGEIDDDKTLNAPVILTYEATNGLSDIPLWAGEIKHGESHILTIEMEGLNDNVSTQNPYPIINEAFRNGKIKLELIDYGSFFRAVDGLQCSQSSLESSLCLLPACLNSDRQILEVFPIENYPHVATCLYGDGGGASPCDSNAYVGNCGGKKVTISPSKYNNDYGCAMCIADATSQPSYSNIFSARPKDFSLKVPEWENGLNRAGVGYGIDLNATTGDSSDTQSDYYNTTLEGHNPPEVIAVIGLEDNASLACPYDSNESQTITFVDGHSTSDINYSNVGNVKLVIMDQNWTQVDQNISYPNNSTCIPDSNETNPVLDPLNRGRVGCKLITEKSMIFVPHHFDIDAILTDHNSINNFTYLHDINSYDNDDNYSMGAALTIDIKAMNFNSNVTSNYMETCYAKDTNLTLALGGTDITYPGSTPALTKFLYYNPVEDDGTANSGEKEHNFTTPITSPITISSLPIENIATTFPADAPEDNGTTHIEYKLNFDRKVNLVVNPFKIILSDVNITDTDNVNGTDNVDQNATFYYARSRASKFFYEDVTTASTPTPIIIDIYCGLPNTSDCSNLGIATVSGKIFENNWYVSTGHTSSDGNITLMVGAPLIEGTGSPSIYSEADTTHRTSLTPTDITTWTSGVDATVTVDSESAVVPLTVPIERVRESDTPTPATYSNEWLVYYPDILMPPSPFYKVRFIGDSSWTGTGITGDVVDIDASKKKSKRMDW